MSKQTEQEEYFTPVRVEDLSNPITRFLSGWFGKKVAPKRYYFADGTVFQPYPHKTLVHDWDLIIQGHSDVTGEKWKPYNKGRPSLNACEADRNVQLDTKLERIRLYQGGLREDVLYWPEPWRSEYRKSHPRGRK